MKPNTPGSRKLVIHMLGFFVVLSCCSWFSGCPPTPRPSGSCGGNSQLPDCPSLTGPGAKFTGQVQSAQPTSNTFLSGPLSAGDTQFLVVLRLPAGSSPDTGDTLQVLITNAKPPTGFLKVVAVPTNPAQHIFTAISVQPATAQEFDDQKIEYQGTEVDPVQCSSSDCGGHTIRFRLNGLDFPFTLSAQTIVQGFGSPATIKAQQMVDVIVHFVKNKSPEVVQVTYPSHSPTLTPTPIPAGTIKEFSLPMANSYPSGIARDPDGNLWFTEYSRNQIGRITPGGKITEFAINTPNGYPTGITLGPDGNLWFTESDGNKIGRITPEGKITEFAIKTANSNPTGIARGPDGNLWFTEYSGNKIGRITPGGAIAEFLLPTPNSYPTGITSGPDNNLWFTEQDRNQIGRITPGGGITEFALPTGNSYPVGIISGPDGNLWFTESDGNRIGQITPAGTITQFSIPTPNSYPTGIISGPDGNLWFTEYDGNQIGQITSGT